MTKWNNQGWDKQYKERLGSDVFEFLTYDSKLIIYLSDHNYIWTQLKPHAHSYQLSDNSIFVLPICKLFEGTLRLIAKDAGWVDEFNSGKEVPNVRQFFRSNREKIEAKIDSISIHDTEKRDIKDKFFSIINDFKDRHEAVHSGRLLNMGEIDNYDSILTKIREVVSLLLRVGIISIGPAILVSSKGTEYGKK
jgi:hypothetical protein